MTKKLFIPAIFFFSVVIFSSCWRAGTTEPQPSSDNNIQSILGSLYILSPQPDVTWKPGSTQKIIWSFPDIVRKVQIRLFRKQELRSILVKEYPNTGSFEWQIPEDILNSVHYKIQVVDVNSNVISKTTEFFYIK